MKICVTGASGYIGRRLVSFAVRRGHDVVAASRCRPTTLTSSWIQFDLSNVQALQLPYGTSFVVHLAARTTLVELVGETSDIVAARELMAQSDGIGAKFIFISSQAARLDAPTSYGRTKWCIEQVIISKGGWVIRPGQVYGGELRGLFGLLVGLVKSLPILPAFLPVPRVQPIHVDDLIHGILNIIERGDIPPAVYCVASAKPISFSGFLAAIANTRLRIWRGFFPVPVVVVGAVSSMLSERWRNRLGLDRLRSLFDLPVMQTASDLQLLGIALRPLRSGMHRSGSKARRQLLQEGHAMLSYILKVKSGIGLTRRYVRAVEQIRGSQALNLPSVLLSIPSSLSLLGKFSWADSTLEAEYVWRLNAATILAEATPLGASRFLGLGRKSGAMRSFIAVAVAVLCDLFWRAVSLPLAPLLRLALAPKQGVV